ncbi:MAG: hypothetical protein KDM63_07260 [Verrucomicrobiae bacterium]|nr:hypothetical protein [Verrucomicrobiae bacterium]
MFRPFPLAILLFVAALPATASDAEQGTSAPALPTPTVRQTTLPNPVADPIVLVNRSQLTPVPKDGLVTLLPGVIEVRFPQPEISFAWDPVECRLLFVWKGKAITDLVAIAEGPAPLSATVGTFGAPQFFGYRFVNGVPEFLYRLGRLAVEERIQPSPDGATLIQHWRVHQSDFDVMLALPERWKEAATCSEGTWKDGFIKIPKEKAGDLALTWQLGKAPGLPLLPEPWLKAIASLPGASPKAPSPPAKTDSSAPEKATPNQ